MDHRRGHQRQWGSGSVRLKRLLLASLVFLLAAAQVSRAQAPDTLMPEQSAAKAKQVLQQGIQALGGTAYLGVRDLTCTGRLSGFMRNGESTGSLRFSSFVKMPNKDRTEYYRKSFYTDIPIVDIFTVGLYAKGVTMEVHNGDQGWTLSGGGVDDTPADALALFQEQRKRSINVILRERLNETGLTFRWGGAEIIDLRPVEWVEISDSGQSPLRLAFDQQTHLPSRIAFRPLDPETHEHSEEIESLSNFHTIQGVLTPLQRTRERNGYKISQVFYDDCKYNSGLSDALFTRAALEERFAQIGKGKKPK